MSYINFTLLVRASSQRYSPFEILQSCILRGPGGERIVDVVPGGTELENRVKTGSWAGRTHSQ